MNRLYEILIWVLVVSGGAFGILYICLALRNMASKQHRAFSLNKLLSHNTRAANPLLASPLELLIRALMCIGSGIALYFLVLK